MRAVALHADVLVFLSDVWQTTCIAVRAGDEGFVIDSPVYPEELRILPEVLQEAGFPVSGLLATHGDWDHLLGRLAFPEASLGCAQTTADRLASALGEPQRKLRAFDDEHYVEGREPLSLGSLQALPVPGRLSIGPTHEVELHLTAGHTTDGVAFWLPWVRVLACGDYLSPVEIPMLSVAGSATAYLETLERLVALVVQAEWVVPGHGVPLDRERALEIAAQDRRYLEQLTSAGDTAVLPRSESSRTQRQIHAENVALTTAGPSR